MGTSTGRKRKTTTADMPQGAFPMFDARSRLITTTASIGWRMAIMIIVPIVIGLKLDEHFNTKPSYVLSGFFLAIAGCSYIIYNEYKAINAESAQMFPVKKQRVTKKNKEAKL